MLFNWNVREDFVEEVIFEVNLPKRISFGATVLGSRAASAVDNGRNEDLPMGNGGAGSGTSE